MIAAMLLGIALVLLLTETVDQGLGIALVAVAAVFEVLEVWFWIYYLRRYKVKSGPEGMIGEKATVVEPCRPQGTVRLRGEIWSAHSLTGAEPGETVKVIGVDGLTLEVE